MPWESIALRGGRRDSRSSGRHPRSSQTVARRNATLQDRPGWSDSVTTNFLREPSLGNKAAHAAGGQSRQTETQRSARACLRGVPDRGCAGLYLIVQASRLKSWVLRFRFGRKTHKLTPGVVADHEAPASPMRSHSRAEAGADARHREGSTLPLRSGLQGQFCRAGGTASRRGVQPLADLSLRLYAEPTPDHAATNKPRTCCAG